MSLLIKTGRPAYGVLVILMIILGILSRKVAAIPLWIGDVLWAMMVFYLFSLVWVNKPAKQVIMYSLLFCYVIEFSQLYKAQWINQVRTTLFGRLVLGSVFSWGDILSYTAGVLLAHLLFVNYRRFLTIF